jgi:hypothetical protein
MSRQPLIHRTAGRSTQSASVSTARTRLFVVGCSVSAEGPQWFITTVRIVRPRSDSGWITAT